MTIRFGTAIFAIPLDFIGMYCFECPICLRYSNLELNNISIKEIRSTARWCAGLLRGIATRGREIDFGRVINFCFALTGVLKREPGCYTNTFAARVPPKHSETISLAELG